MGLYKQDGFLVGQAEDTELCIWQLLGGNTMDFASSFLMRVTGNLQRVSALEININNQYIAMLTCLIYT